MPVAIKKKFRKHSKPKVTVTPDLRPTVYMGDGDILIDVSKQANNRILGGLPVETFELTFARADRPLPVGTPVSAAMVKDCETLARVVSTRQSLEVLRDLINNALDSGGGL